MSQTLSTDEILRRMKMQVEKHEVDAQARQDGREVPLINATSGASDTPTESRTEFSHFESSDFKPLELEIDTALDGTRQVGQINPRGSGLHNDVIQFIKRVMRRSLTWYTRPIHHFQGGTIRALQQVLVLLRMHDNSLQLVSRQVGQQHALVGQQHALSEGQARESAEHHAVTAEAISDNRHRLAELEVAAIELKVRTSALAKETLELAAKTADLRRWREDLDKKFEQVSLDFQQRITQALEQTISSQDTKFDCKFTVYGERLEGMIGEIGSLRAQLDRAERRVSEAILQGRLRERDLRRFFHGVQNAPQSPLSRSVPTPPMFRSGVKHHSEFDYFKFEELFRGDESLITSRQNEYLKFFQGRDNVVDIGCGRGEFLELLRDQGIRARGVESGTDQYLLCREKGLDVVQQDLFSFLESLPDESLGGLFCAQVIEHLSADDQLRFVALAYQKTAPGSPVIFETINAQSVFAVLRNFFVDPTHVRPVHPETLKFAMQSMMFRDVEVRFTSPMLEPRIPALEINGEAHITGFNHAIEQLNDLIYGYLDYAAIGWH